MESYTQWKELTTDITPSTSAYASGDVVGGLLTFNYVSAAGGAFLNAVRIVDQETKNNTFRLWLFNEAPATIADNAAFTQTLANKQKRIGYVDIDTWVDGFAKVSDINDALPLPNHKLYAYLVLNGSTPTYSSSQTISLYLDFLGEGA